MSILAYTGLPGAGKSYAVVEHQVLPAVKAGRRVVTNIPLAWDVLRQRFPGAELVELPLEKISASPEVIFEYVTPGSVLVLDEVWRVFPAGLKANHVPEPFRKLLAEHRHMVNDKNEACQIVLVTQDLAQVAAFARQLVEQTFRTVKLSAVGIRGGYRLDVFQGPVSGPNPPLQNRLREVYGRYSKDVWSLYQSHTMSEAKDGGADERAVDRRGNLLRSPALLATAAVVVLGLVFIIPRATGLLEKDGMAKLAGAKEPGASLSVAAPAARPSSSLVPIPGATVATSSSSAQVKPWRIVAYIQNLDFPQRSVVMLSNGESKITLPSAGICSKGRDDLLRCQFDGREVTEWGERPAATLVDS